MQAEDRPSGRGAVSPPVVSGARLTMLNTTVDVTELTSP
jgi:hypothetical protein